VNADRVWIAGVGMTAFGFRPDSSVKELTREAVTAALADAGVQRTGVHAAYFGNTCQDVLEGQVVVAGQMALRAMGFEEIPIVNVENACATGATAFQQAVMHVRSGAADVVLAVGVERLSVGDKRRALGVFDGGVDVNDPEGVDAVLAELGGLDPQAGASPGSDDGRPRSKFMDVYAALAHAHMAEFGTSAEHLAAIAEKNHGHAVENRFAHFRTAMSREEILKARPVAGPLTVPMCAPLTDGAAAAIVCNEAGRRKLAPASPIEVIASVSGSGTVRSLADWDRSATRVAALKAYEQAGIGPAEVSVAEVHDASAFGELLQTELMGFCPIGGGGEFVESGASRIGGRLPVNPSGGLESRGHPMGASGLAQIYELVQQLRGACGPRQVSGARIALAENGGGFYGGEEAAAAITILRS
jgi:acetyl-CoA acyltransferase